MHLFITGATGYIGSVCVEKAIAEGHTVHGLSRTEAGDAKLTALGVIPIRGDLTTFSLLAQESAKADVVLHCAFNHDFSGGAFEENVRIDCEAINALADGLKGSGSGKHLIVSSACGGRVPDPDGGEVDETAAEDANFPLKARRVSDAHAMAKDGDGVKVSLLHIAPLVYGRAGSAFVPMLIARAHAAREALYIGDGSQKMTTLHVDDAATLYLALAKHSASTGGAFNASGSTTNTAKEVAEAVGTLLHVPVRSVTLEEAVKEENLGPLLSMVMGTQYVCRASSKKAREELGWKPTGVDLPTDVAHGSYTKYAAKLAQNV
ncbi:Uncharacterized protein LHYA1_G007561 [Lachnellula hyalina]|uniref:NAD-dependent epimerase/dehydratase domain-containing protein n=1 Tax=Lachnellula hyalina TaxID=1316788 RepID=A0A8H8TXX5_9HELO|nr:Uncharacterized protein LHYA1_G007561 [Lachnellula hyalina]TVY24775.1 Uncharacterized protein LHYA1_G007561 [Lachnellula hyalina]